VARYDLKVFLSSFLTTFLCIIIHESSVVLSYSELLTASSNTLPVKQLDCWNSYFLGDEVSFDYPVKNDHLQHVRYFYQFYLEHRICYPLLRRTRLIASNWASVGLRKRLTQVFSHAAISKDSFASSCLRTTFFTHQFPQALEERTICNCLPYGRNDLKCCRKGRYFYIGWGLGCHEHGI